MDRGEANAAPSGAERRRHRRFPCEGWAEVICCDTWAFFRGRIRDVSLEGCFIETAARIQLRRLSVVELRFTTGGLHITARARLMAIRPGQGAGFEFMPREGRMADSFLQLLDDLKSAGDKSPV